MCTHNSNQVSNFRNREREKKRNSKKREQTTRNLERSIEKIHAPRTHEIEGECVCVCLSEEASESERDRAHNSFLRSQTFTRTRPFAGSLI